MNRAFRGACVLAAFCILLAGCAASEQMPSGPLDAAALAAQQNWELRGRVAVSAQGRSEQAKVRWRQDGPLAAVELSGPWGMGAEQLRIAGEDVRLLSDGSWIPMCVEELSVDELELLCASAPLGSLLFWLRGLPDPALPHTEPPPVEGAARQFQQAGWLVSVSTLQRSGDLAVPRRLDISGPGATMKVVITDWELSASP